MSDVKSLYMTFREIQEEVCPDVHCNDREEEESR